MYARLSKLYEEREYREVVGAIVSTTIMEYDEDRLGYRYVREYRVKLTSLERQALASVNKMLERAGGEWGPLSGGGIFYCKKEEFISVEPG